MNKWLDKARKIEAESGNPNSFDVLNPETKKTVRLDLLTVIERQAFDGWLGSVRQSKHGHTEEKARQIAWQLLIVSMESMYKRGGGRYAKD